MSEVKMTLGQMGEEIGSHLDVMAKLFVDGMKLTFIARLPGNNEADFVLSNDHIEQVGKLVDRRIGVTEDNPWNDPGDIPDVPIGTEEQYWIACKNDKERVFTYIAHYQNRPLDEENGDSYLFNLDGDQIESIGWVDCKEHSEFDNYYTPISFDEKYVLIGWAECIPPAIPEGIQESDND